MTLLLTGCVTESDTKVPGSLVCEALCDDCEQCTMRCNLIDTGEIKESMEVKNVVP